MRLKKLELYGFKSFAQRTEIVFNEGITAIVGPNGSGKSNIGDAVRWVLGEQSAKTLRGASMQDVIFSGTQTRRPLSYCEVSLIFDNEDHTLPLEYSEVMVTRRVYRSGESEYFLNRSSCRLKDVVDLFRDTGIGKEGYSIIGQGRIDEILSRKGEDRRLVFEEAAGIVKFKARKEEADRKLGRTLENMTRVDDILDELKRQLAPLEEQSKNARIYLGLAAELKELDLNLFLVRSEKMEAKLRDYDQELQSIKAVLEQTEISLQEKSEERDARQAEISELDGKISEAHAAMLAGVEAVHAAGDALHTMEEKKRSRQENRERVLGELSQGEERLEELDRMAGESSSGSEERSGVLQRQAGELEKAKEAEEDARRKQNEREETLEAHKNAMIDAINRRTAALNDQTRLKTMLTTMEERLQEVTVSCEAMKRAGTDLDGAVQEARERLQAEQEKRQNLDRLVQEAREQLALLETRQDMLRQEIQEAREAQQRCKETAARAQGQIGQLREQMKQFAAAFSKKEYPQLSPAYCGAEQGMLCIGPDGLLYPCWDLVAMEEEAVGFTDPETGRFFFSFAKAKWRTRTSDLMKPCQSCPYVFICRGGCAPEAKQAHGSCFRENCGEIREIFAFVASRAAGKKWKETKEDELSVSLAGPLSRLTVQERETLMTATGQKEIYDILDQAGFFFSASN